jgi:ribosomal protein S18 acetylase RimI-like enzyme
VEIRPFISADTTAVVQLLKSNTPKYFAPSEEKDLLQYLGTEREDYYVVEEAGVVLGAGGINYFPENQEARISWDIIHPKVQGKGVGRKLLEFRLHRLQTNQSVTTIVVRTSQLVYPFYEKCGFRLKTIQEDYWAKGFDLYRMELNNQPKLGATNN